jgi:hypothetical protein
MHVNLTSREFCTTYCVGDRGGKSPLRSRRNPCGVRRVLLNMLIWSELIIVLARATDQQLTVEDKGMI